MRNIALFAFLILGCIYFLPQQKIFAQYNNNCACLGNGNCSDGGPGGTFCYTGSVLACGDQCPPGYKNVEMRCGDRSCGGKCALDQTCNTGYCSSGPPTCNTVDGDFLCGSGGCGGCYRFVRETTCSGSQCQINCSLDETCGAGCGGSGGGATSTPGGGGGSCGNGSCGGSETCGTCPSDCGACPTNTPGGPTNTPVPTSTPIPYGTIRARAVAVDPSDTTCAAIRAVPTTDSNISGTSHQFTSSSASQPAPQSQTGANYVTFSNAPTGSYTLDTPGLPTTDWVLARACWSIAAGSIGEGYNALLGVNETLTYDIGYTLGTPWVQTQGGDVYAAGTIKSYIPAVVPRVFSRDGAGGYPGVVTYGTSFDFDGTSAAIDSLLTLMQSGFRSHA